MPAVTSVSPRPTSLRTQGAAGPRALVAPSRAELFRHVEGAIRAHHFTGRGSLLARFDPQNLHDQQAGGIRPAQYLAEAFGLRLPMPISMASLQELRSFAIDARRPISVGPDGYSSWRGTATFKGGRTQPIEVTVKKVPGGYVLSGGVG